METGPSPGLGALIGEARNGEHPMPNYPGPERRRHRMYVTRNTEYHFRDNLCVGVRDLHTGQWLPSHLALGRKLTGAVRLMQNGTPVPILAAPGVGESL